MVCITSSESCEPKRFSQCWNKLERKFIREKQPSQFRCYNQNIGFVNRMDQSWGSYRIGVRMKKWWWHLFVWMVDVVLQGVRVLYRFNKNECDESLPLLAFRIDVISTIFQKYLKEGRLSSSHLGIRNIPSVVCYDDAKHYQVLSEPGVLRNPSSI